VITTLVRLARGLLAAWGLICALPVFAGESPVGRYRIAEGPDVASQLEIRADGRFSYMLSAGALDEHAQGRWQSIDSSIYLFTEPRPVPPVFSAIAPTHNKGVAVSVQVTWPNGKGIGGIEFRMGFETGEPMSGTTQDYGWSMPMGEHRVPQWIILAEPMHGIISPRFPINIANGNALRFTLTPNDLGVFDFQGAEANVTATELRLHRDGAILRYIREKR